MYIKELQKWAKEHQISTRIIEAFQNYLANYEADDPKEYAAVMGEIDKNKLRYNVHTVSMNLGNWPECTYNTVSVSMRVFYNEKQIANYRVDYLFSGEAEDDTIDFLL